MTPHADLDGPADGLRSVLSAGGPWTASMLWLDEHGRIARCSAALEARLGRGGLVGGDVLDIVCAVDRERAARLLSAGREFQTTGTLRIGADTASAWQARVSAAPASVGERPGVAVYITDVLAPARTGGEDLDALLSSRERFLQTLVDHLPGQVSFWTPALRCTFVSGGAHDGFGGEPQQALGRHLSELLGPQLFALNEPHARAALAGQPQRFERMLVKPDGSLGHSWWQYIPYVEGGAVHGMLHLVSDITEAKEAQLALERSHQALAGEAAIRENTEAALAVSLQMYRSLLHTLLNGFVYCRVLIEAGELVDYVYLEVNRAYEEMLNLRDVVGRRASEVGHRFSRPQSPVLTMFARVALTGTPERTEVYAPKLGRWLSLSAGRPHEGHLFIVFEDITERKMAFERLRSVFDASPGAICISNLADGRVIEVNDAFLAIVGYSREEVIDRSTVDLGIWRSRADRDQVMNRVRATGHVHNVVVDLVAKGGHGGRVLMSVEVLQKGGELCSLVYLVDVDALDRAHAALRSSERRYRALFGNLPGAFLYARLVQAGDEAVDFVVLEVNAAFERISGLRRVEGRMMTEVLPDVHLRTPELLQRAAQVVLGGASDRFEIYVARLKAWFMASLYRPHDDHFVAILEDITDRKRTEAALQLAQARFEGLTDSNIVGVAIGDANGGLSLANDYYLRQLGATRADFDAGLVRWDRVTTPQERALDMKAIAELRATGRSTPYEKEFLHPGGERTHVQIRLAWLPGGNGEMLAIVLDISALYRAQRALEQANLALASRTLEAEAANVAKSNFLSSVNHELRTPVHTLLGYARLLLRRSDGETLRQLEIIEQSGLQLNRLIDDLLQFRAGGQAPDSLRLRALDLRAAVGRFEALGHTLVAGDRNEFALLMADDLPPAVMVDDQRLFQVLQNLLGNAGKYTAGGRVSLSVTRAADLGSADGDPHRCRLVFAVADNGIGIAAEDQARIFSAFQRGADTRGQSGLGLGLAIARHWVEAMGGQLDVDSAIGSGSRFSFALDLGIASPRTAFEEAQPAPAGPSPADLEPATPRHVLVVDDLATNRDYLRELCAEWGYRVTEAAGGEAALGVCLTACPAVDAVLVDQFMPEMDGWAFLQELRRIPACAGLPVALVSASAPQRPRGFPPELEFDGFLGKPLDEPALQNWLRGQFGQALCLPAPEVGLPQPAAVHLPGDELATLRRLLDLGRLIAIARWAEALAARHPDLAGFVARVVACCRSADLAGLEALAAAALAAGDAAA